MIRFFSPLGDLEFGAQRARPDLHGRVERGAESLIELSERGELGNTEHPRRDIAVVVDVVEGDINRHGSNRGVANMDHDWSLSFGEHRL